LPIFVKNIAMAKNLRLSAKKPKNCWKKNGPASLLLFYPENLLKFFGVDKKTIALRIPHYPFLIPCWKL